MAELIKGTMVDGKTIYVNADLVLWVHPLPGTVERTAIALAGQRENGGLVIVNVRESVENVVLALGGCVDVA